MEKTPFQCSTLDGINLAKEIRKWLWVRVKVVRGATQSRMMRINSFLSNSWFTRNSKGALLTRVTLLRLRTPYLRLAFQMLSQLRECWSFSPIPRSTTTFIHNTCKPKPFSFFSSPIHSRPERTCSSSPQTAATYMHNSSKPKTHFSPATSGRDKRGCTLSLEALTFSLEVNCVWKSRERENPCTHQGSSFLFCRRLHSTNLKFLKISILH